MMRQFRQAVGAPMPDRRALAAALDSQEVAVATACARRRHTPSSLTPTPLPFKRGIPLRGWAGARGWLLANTFTPAWMTGGWRHPAVSYVVAVLLQVVALSMVVGLVQIFPGFPFAGALPILAVVVAALGWGTGPSLLATLVGALLLVVLMLPPGFSAGLSHVEDVARIVLYTMIGVTIGVSVGHSARARRRARGLAGQGP